jgi:putative two-component system response regulator
MRQVLISNADCTLYDTVKMTLQDYYAVRPLPLVSDLQSYLSQNKVELVLLPVSEEHTECIEVYKQLNDIPRTQDWPIIFFTGKSNLQMEKMLLAQGAQYFIRLPATAAMLYAELENILELFMLRNYREFTDKYQDAIAFSFAELVDCRDETTGEHLKNTMQYFHVLMEEAIANNYYKDVLEQEDVRDLLRSAILHDIGKIGINDDILRKASPLNYHEYQHMKTHTTLGKQAFENIIDETGGTRWLYLAKDIAYCHHERWDGTGYPNGLRGEEISIFARIMAVADVYDALTQTRPYKNPYTHDQAMRMIIEERGRSFDPRLVDLFVNANERFKDILLSRNGNCDLIEKE